MEKIKSVIDAAKKQSTKVNENRSVPDISSSFIKKDNKEIKVDYKETRVLSLNEEHLEKNRIISFNKNDHLSLHFDILRTQVLKKMKANNWKSIAVTSPIPACGKTLVSINLAMSIAHNTDTTAMLIDLDLRRPKVKKYLGLPAGPSLNDVINGDADISEALINPDLERLVVLPTAKPVSHSSEVLSSKKLINLIDEIQNRYADRITVFDLTPLLGTDDAMTVLSQVDCVLVVIGNGMVSKSELEKSMKYIDSNKLLGTVLNKANTEQQKEYYDY